MTRPTITINGVEKKMRQLTGRDWRLLGEFKDTAPQFTDADFLEKHAAFIAEFYPDVDAEDVLNMPLEEIAPASLAVQNYVIRQLSAKLERIEKNSEAGKAQ